MNEKYTFSTANEALPFLCSRILDIGDEVGSRNGRVKELLNTQIVLKDPQRREILSPNRKANVFAQIAETMWVLAGRNDIEWLSAYLPRAADFSDDGETWRGGYGPRIRGEFNGWPDQIAHVVDLLQKDPLSRRAVVAIYSPDLDIPAGKDVPCNDFIQFQSRLGALHMTVTVRSNDLMWGWSGINAFEWSTLQEIVAHLIGNTVGTLTFNIGSLHLYEQHWNKAASIHHEPADDLVITPFQMPEHMDRTLEWVDLQIDRWFKWEEACRRGEATIDRLNDDFHEPLFWSWAAAIAWYWQRGDEWLETLHGTALRVAMARTPASLLPEPRTTSRSAGVAPGATGTLHDRTRAFCDFVANLHATKHASYGDSWKKRGEQMSILANMARKVDRLGVGDEYDSSADTLIDFLVYAIKYECWLNGIDDGPDNVNPALSSYLLGCEFIQTNERTVRAGIADIVEMFNHYCEQVEVYSTRSKCDFLTEMIQMVAPIARDVWWAEQDEDDGDHRDRRLADEYRGADAD